MTLSEADRINVLQDESRRLEGNIFSPIETSTSCRSTLALMQSEALTIGMSVSDAVVRLFLFTNGHTVGQYADGIVEGGEN